MLEILKHSNFESLEVRKFAMNGNMLKPALSRGDLQVIGSTTIEDFKVRTPLMGPTHIVPPDPGIGEIKGYFFIG